MINKINALGTTTGSMQKNINRSLEFNKLLEDAQRSSSLKISGHALDRLRQREIHLSDNDMANLNRAVESIRNKGGREALILYKNTAFITSVKNNTVITAVDSESLKDNIFTNIDSAMIL